MKRCRKQPAPGKPEPTPDQIRQYMNALADQHHEAWHAELMSDAPYWTYLLGLHLRMVELENLERGAEALL